MEWDWKKAKAISETKENIILKIIPASFCLLPWPTNTGFGDFFFIFFFLINVHALSFFLSFKKAANPFVPWMSLPNGLTWTVMLPARTPLWEDGESSVCQPWSGGWAESDHYPFSNVLWVVTANSSRPMTRFLQQRDVHCYKASILQRKHFQFHFLPAVEEKKITATTVNKEKQFRQVC